MIVNMQRTSNIPASQSRVIPHVQKLSMFNRSVAARPGGLLTPLLPALEPLARAKTAHIAHSLYHKAHSTPQRAGNSIAAGPGALFALLVPALEPLAGAQRAVCALEHSALISALALLRHTAVVLVVPRVAVPRLQPVPKGCPSAFQDAGGRAKDQVQLWLRFCSAAQPQSWASCMHLTKPCACIAWYAADGMVCETQTSDIPKLGSGSLMPA